MIEVDATLFTLLAEGFVLACVILLISFGLSARRNGRDRKALRALVANINEEAAVRLDRTKALCAGDSATALNKFERSVCQAVIGVYNKRNAASLDTIYAAVKMLVDGYQQQLEGLQQSKVSEPPPDEAAEPRDAEISKLKSDFEQAERELQVTKRTMEKMLLEYNSMFAGGQGEETAAEIEAEEILQMLDPERSEDVVDRTGDNDESVDRDFDIEAKAAST